MAWTSTLCWVRTTPAIAPATATGLLVAETLSTSTVLGSPMGWDDCWSANVVDAEARGSPGGRDSQEPPTESQFGPWLAPVQVGYGQPMAIQPLSPQAAHFQPLPLAVSARRPPMPAALGRPPRGPLGHLGRQVNDPHPGRLAQPLAETGRLPQA